jgi:hypothetical protein
MESDQKQAINQLILIQNACFSPHFIEISHFIAFLVFNTKNGHFWASIWSIPYISTKNRNYA